RLGVQTRYEAASGEAAEAEQRTGLAVFQTTVQHAGLQIRRRVRENVGPTAVHSPARRFVGHEELDRLERQVDPLSVSVDQVFVAQVRALVEDPDARREGAAPVRDR